MKETQKPFVSADVSVMLLIASLLGALVAAPFLVARGFSILGGLIAAIVAILAWMYVGPKPSPKYTNGIAGLFGFVVLIGALIVWLSRAIHYEPLQVPHFPKWFLPALIVAVGTECILALVARKFSHVLAFGLCLLAALQSLAGWYIIHAPAYIAGAADLGGANFGPLFAFFFLFWGSIAAWWCCVVVALFLARGHAKAS